MGQQDIERPTTTPQKFTSCGLNLRILCPVVVYSVELLKMASEVHAEHKYAGSCSVSIKSQLLNVVFV